MHPDQKERSLSQPSLQRRRGRARGFSRVVAHLATAGCALVLFSAAPALANALYNPTLGAPFCAGIGASCDSGTLLERSGHMTPPEANQPNTVDGCLDGSESLKHLKDESIERIVVSTVDGQPMVPGARVRVEVTYFPYGSGRSERLLIAYTSDGLNPSATFHELPTYLPTQGGLQTHTVEYTLPSGPVHRVRARMAHVHYTDRCDGYGYYDVDELVFRVGSVASYSESLRAPACSGPTGFCHSGTLLRSRGSIDVPELRNPNTIDGCPDGSFGSYFVDDSIESVSVQSVHGDDLIAGTRAEITAQVYASGALTSLDFFYTASTDPGNLDWILIGTRDMPFTAGESALTMQYTLPVGDVQAVRVSLRFRNSDPSSCPSGGGFEDGDDLVFDVQSPDTSFSDAYQVGHGVGRVLAGLCGATDPHECDALPSLKYLPVTVRSMDTSEHFEHWYNYLIGPKELHDDFKCTASDGTEQDCLNNDDTVVEEFLTDTIAVAGESWDPEEHYALAECSGQTCGHEQVVFRGPSYQGLLGTTRAKIYHPRNNCILKASQHHMNLWDRLICAIDPLHLRDDLEDMLPIVTLPTTPEEIHSDVYAVFSCARGASLNEVEASVLDERAALPSVNSSFNCGLDEDTMNYLASQMQSLGSAWREVGVDGLYMAAQGAAFFALTGGVGYIFAEAAEIAGTTAEGVNLARQVGVTLARTSINGYFLVSAVRAIPACDGDKDCETLGMIQLAMSLASMGEVATDFEAGKAAARDYLRSQNPDLELMTPLLQGMGDGYDVHGGTGDLFPEGSEFTPEGPTAGIPGGCR